MVEGEKKIDYVRQNCISRTAAIYLSGICHVFGALLTTALRIYLTKRLITILLVILYQIHFSDEGTKVFPHLQFGYPLI